VLWALQGAKSWQNTNNTINANAIFILTPPGIDMHKAIKAFRTQKDNCRVLKWAFLDA